MSYEKVSVNVDNKKLAQMDLLIENDFYGNRSDFINEAIDALLEKNAKITDGLLEQKSDDDLILCEKGIWFLGVNSINKAFLLKAKNLGRHLQIKGFGVLNFSKDCDEELIKETVANIAKGITINGPKGIKEYYKAKK